MRCLSFPETEQGPPEALLTGPLRGRWRQGLESPTAPLSRGAKAVSGAGSGARGMGLMPTLSPTPLKQAGLGLSSASFTQRCHPSP